MPNKKSPLTPEDREHFQEAMKGVKRIKPEDRIQAPRPKKSAPKRPTSPYFLEEEQSPGLSDFVANPIEAEASVTFAQSGISSQYFKKLKQGVFIPEATLDLHGMTVAEAREALQRFIAESLRQHLRVIHIIHGKGHRGKNEPPVLKNQVNVWLRQYKQVLAFSSALPKDGGTGAVYVLLRRFLDQN